MVGKTLYVKPWPLSCEGSARFCSKDLFFGEYLCFVKEEKADRLEAAMASSSASNSAGKFIPQTYVIS